MLHEVISVDNYHYLFAETMYSLTDS